MSTVWAVQMAHIWGREKHIFRFLRDERCSVRIVEVRLFKTSRTIRPNAYGHAALGAWRRFERDR